MLLRNFNSAAIVCGKNQSVKFRTGVLCMARKSAKGNRRRMYDSILKDIGKRISDTRLSRNMTTAELAQLVDVDASTISRAENARGEVTFDVAMKLAHVVGLTGLATQENLVIHEASVPDRINASTRPSLKYRWPEEEVVILVRWFSVEPQEVEAYIATWLNLLFRRNVETKRSDRLQAQPFTAVDAGRLLGLDGVVRAAIADPPLDVIDLVCEIYRLAAVLSSDQMNKLLAAIAEDAILWDKLDRRSRETLRRLQSGLTERMKLTDVLKLSELIQIDLVDMYFSVDDSRPVSVDAERVDPNAVKRELVSLLVTLTGWAQYKLGNPELMFEVFRRELSQWNRTTAVSHWPQR